MANKKQTSELVVHSNVTASVSGLKKKTAPLVKLVEACTIRTVEDQEKMVHALKQIKAYGVEAEKQKAAFVDPAKAIISQAKELFAPFLQSVEDATELGKGKIKEFVDKRLLKASEVQTAHDNGKMSMGKAISKTSELLTNDNARQVYKLKIVQPGRIPRKFLVPDETKIREAFKKGKKVPGCKWEQETTIAI